jgi:tRNA pseudouridine38-40 synthase
MEEIKKQIKYRYLMEIEYDGTNYFGFQKQIKDCLPTIEESLINAIYKLTGENVEIFASGRTDSGVHSLGQSIHFDLTKKFLTKEICFGLNHFFRTNNDAISVLNCEIVDQNFHVRYNALMRYYRYVIINRNAQLAIDKNRAWHIRKKLDISSMIESSQFLIGKHDFTSFRDSQCQANSPIKTIQNINFNIDDSKIIIEFSAKSFLHHMVRNIVGTLVYAGLSKIKPDDIKSILTAKDRTKSGPNAPACGLYFLRTDYNFLDKITNNK